MPEKDLFSAETLRPLYEQHVATQAKKYADLQVQQGHWKERLDILFSFPGPVKNMNILDAGCGIGTLALEAAKRGAKSFGLDFTFGMVNQGRTFANEQNLSSCFFAAGDVSKIPFQSEMFDIIFASDIIEHLPERALLKALDECRRLLKPGGKFILHTFPTKYDYFFERKAFMVFVIPFFWMPHSLLKKYLGFLHHKVIPVLRRMLWTLQIVKTPHGDVLHCNCQDAQELEQKIKKAGMHVANRLVTTLYHGGDYGMPFREKKTVARKLMETLFRNAPVLHRNIFLVCVNEKNENPCRSA